MVKLLNRTTLNVLTAVTEAEGGLPRFGEAGWRYGKVLANLERAGLVRLDYANRWTLTEAGTVERDELQEESDLRDAEREMERLAEQEDRSPDSGQYWGLY